MEELLSRGIRLTPQRRVVIEILQQAPEHLGAAALLSLARQREPHIDRATVYRTLKLLRKLRQQREQRTEQTPMGGDHLQLACFECGRIEEFSAALFQDLKTRIGAETGYEVHVTRLQARGRCRACAGRHPPAGQ